MIYAYDCYYVILFFKQKTAYEMRISDWSSDVCSSDLGGVEPPIAGLRLRRRAAAQRQRQQANHLDPLADRQHQRRPRVHRAGRARDAPPVEPDMPRLDHRLRDAARARETQEPQQLVAPDAS